MADNIRINTFENFILKNSGNFFKNISEPVNKKVGWFCTYVPEEIITAAGFIPERITGQEKAKKAESYFPINFCSFIKCAMEDLLGFIENENNVSGLIFTNSCDGMRRFYDMCKSYVRSIPCFMLDVPRIKNNLSLRQFSNNIKKMAVFLNDIGGQNIDSGSIEKSIKLHGEKRMLLTRLHSLFKKYPDSVGISNYFNIIKYAMTSEPVLFTMQLEKYLRAAEAETEGIYLKDSNAASDKKPHHTASPPVMLIGNFIYEVKLWEMLDELHCNLSAVDTCSGERYFKKTDYGVEAEIISGVTGNQDLKNSQPEAAYAEKQITDIALGLFMKPQCMRMADLGAKIDEIRQTISKNKIKGLIFISQKFCDNTLLFYPLLRENLNMLRIPSLFLEIEHNNLSLGQIKTRIQAFLEII